MTTGAAEPEDVLVSLIDTKAVRLGKRETALLDRMKAGAVLCCEADDTEEGRANDCRRWFLEPGGRVVGPKTARALVTRGFVKPNCAGLFHEFDAQTYVVVQ